jgi:tripartite-type tricarboxylate transporter receptor subunit TctC
MMPFDTPKAIIEKISAEAIGAVRTKEVNERVAAIGFTPTGLGPAEFGEIIKKDVSRWREIVRIRNIQAA